MKWKPIAELDRAETQRVLVAQDGDITILTWKMIRQAWFTDSGEQVLPRDEFGQPTHYCDLPNAPA